MNLAYGSSYNVHNCLLLLCSFYELFINPTGTTFIIVGPITLFFFFKNTLVQTC